MKNEIVVFTTVFPSVLSYLDVLLESLINQTNKDFDLFIANDGVLNLEKNLCQFNDFNTIIFDVNSTISKNRERAIKKIIDLGYKFVIFVDSDDYIENNRIEVSLKKMKKYDIVINDVSLFDKKGVYNDKYFSKRIMNNAEINIDFIEDKNIFGLSNTSTKIELLDGIVFNEKLKAVDWYLFTCILQKGANSVFTNETRTFYRQYENNLSGIDKYDKKSLINCLSVKKMHYKEMSLVDEKYKTLYDEMCVLEKAVLSDFFLLEKNKIDLFWWEVTNYIKIL